MRGFTMRMASTLRSVKYSSPTARCFFSLGISDVRCFAIPLPAAWWIRRRKIDLNIGKDFDYVFISIDPSDTPTLATLKRNSYVTEYDRPGSAGGFHILVAQPNEIAEMANAVGFGYKPAQNDQFAHPAVAMVITPDGRISKYLYPPKAGDLVSRASLAAVRWRMRRGNKSGHPRTRSC